MRKRYLILVALLCLAEYGYGQNRPKKGKLDFLASHHFDDSPRGDNKLRFVFYNVENLFDTKDDSLKRDEAFTPFGERHWTWEKFNRKLTKTAKTIRAIGGWEPPEIIGLCEIENRYVLNKLIYHPILDSLNYRIIHQDSPDRRGIDVALLYLPEKFKILDHSFIPIRFPFSPDSRTRDVLYVKGETNNKDTLHLFVNHWPSKFGGEIETQPKRNFVGQLLHQKVDSLLAMNPESKIILTGDLNDEPDSESIVGALGANFPSDTIENTQLYNLMAPLQWQSGTHFFGGEWGILDQFIVSGSLLNSDSHSFVSNGRAQIYDADFLMKENAAGEKVPDRTFQGPMYLGGFSDHLPIFMDINLVQSSN
ncbi:MAG: endonuclease [Bacteroidota bacterium]